MGIANKVVGNMIGGYNFQGRGRVDLTPLRAKLKETEAMARKYQSGTPAKIDLGPVVKALRDLEAYVIRMQKTAHMKA